MSKRAGRRHGSRNKEVENEEVRVKCHVRFGPTQFAQSPLAWGVLGRFFFFFCPSPRCSGATNYCEQRWGNVIPPRPHRAVQSKWW